MNDLSEARFTGVMLVALIAALALLTGCVGQRELIQTANEGAETTGDSYFKVLGLLRSYDQYQASLERLLVNASNGDTRIPTRRLRQAQQLDARITPRLAALLSLKNQYEDHRAGLKSCDGSRECQLVYLENNLAAGYAAVVTDVGRFRDLVQ